MIVVATTEGELAGMCNRLRALGVRSVDVVAPSDTRRVVPASAEDAAGAAGLVVSLRAEGVMAVTRPDGGVAGVMAVTRPDGGAALDLLGF